MNMSAQKKKLTILSILLVLCVLGLGYWYFFMYRCGVLPKEYEFLERFVVRNECKEREYKVKGIMYNIREGEDGNKILFDFNAWDTESRESLYYENIQISKDKISGEFEVIPDNYGAVEIVMKFEKGIFTLKNYNLENLSVDELKLTEEKYAEVFNTVYTAITRSPLADDNEYQSIPSEELNAVITEVMWVDEINEYGPSLTNSFTNNQLYRPWLLSYIYKNKLDTVSTVGKQEIIDMLLFDIDEFFDKLLLENPITECYEPAMCEDVLNSPENNVEEEYKKYQFSNSFACLMVWQITENLDLDNNEIITKYCDKGYFENSMNNMYPEVVELIDDALDRYVSLLNLSILDKNPENRDVYFHSSNIASILADTYAFKNLYNEDINKGLESRINEVLNYMDLYGAPYLKNICSISYFSNLALGDSAFKDSSTIKLIGDETNKVFSPMSKGLLELIDDDPYGSLLCFESNDEETIKSIKKIEILKIINLNIYNDTKRGGIWIKDEYDIRVNARFLHLLMFNKDLLL